MADQKVTLVPHPPDPVTTRPLKTGAQFTLVLPKKRFVYRHWDKEKYLPGEDAELIMEGEGIGSEKYEFIIEKADTESGPWTEVTTLKTDVQGDKATVNYLESDGDKEKLTLVKEDGKWKVSLAMPKGTTP